MKKYNHFILENQQDNIDVEINNTYEKLFNSIRTFVIRNVYTSRMINFEKDEDPALLKKRKNNKYDEYVKKIDNIFKERFEKKDIQYLTTLLQNKNYKIYHQIIQEILNKKTQNQNSEPTPEVTK